MQPSRTYLAVFVTVALVLPARGQAQWATKVVVAEAEEQDAPSTITLVGTVNAFRVSRVSAEIEGTVRNMPVRAGDRVESGGILCELKDEDLTLKLAEAKARLGGLQARHEELLAGTRKEELSRLKAVLDETGADLDRWTFEMARIKRLYEAADSNEKEFYETRAELLGAERRKVAAQARYDEAISGPRREVIAQAAFEVAAQKAVADRLEIDLLNTRIRAPFSGYVTQRLAEVGEWIPAGGAIIELAELGLVLVRVDAPESAFPYLVVGSPARVAVDAVKRAFEGRIKHVVPLADPNARTVPVEIEVDNAEGLLAGGMFARATVAAGPRMKMVAVPKDAVVEKDGVSYVAVVFPGKNGSMMGVTQAVTVGMDIDEWIAVTSGNIKPGTLVVTRGNERILPFPVEVVIVDEQGTPVATPFDGKEPATVPTHPERSEGA